MTFYGSTQREVDVDFDVEDDEIVEYIKEKPQRLEWFMNELGVNREAVFDARYIMDSLKSIDRDAFLADLARECALLGVEWPPSCKEATRVIHRPQANPDPGCGIA